MTKEEALSELLSIAPTQELKNSIMDISLDIGLLNSFIKILEKVRVNYANGTNQNVYLDKDFDVALFISILDQLGYKLIKK